MVVVMEDDMPIDELSEKAFKCLVDNFGYFNALNYTLHLMEEGRKTPINSSETDVFEGMTDEEIINGAIEYAKTHHLE